MGDLPPLKSVQVVLMLFRPLEQKVIDVGFQRIERQTT